MPAPGDGKIPRRHAWRFPFSGTDNPNKEHRAHMNFRRHLILTAALGLGAAARAQTADTAPVDKLDAYIVTGQLDVSRESIVPSLGATSFIVDEQQILNLPQGNDAP